MANCSADVVRRIGLTSGIVRSLNKMWEAEDTSKATKVLLYRSMMQAIVLYNSETWTVRSEDKQKLHVCFTCFKMSVLRKICRLLRRDHKRNVDIIKELGMEKDIVGVLVCRRPHLYG